MLDIKIFKMKKRNPPTLLWECRLVQTLWRTVWRFLKKLELLHDPAVPHLGKDTDELPI